MPPVPITVSIPTHDRRETCVLAVRSALAQTRPPEEVIVLCDGCTDGTPEALAALGDPRVVVLDLPKGPGYGYGHRNLALERARGEAILWLGDDDLLFPDHLACIGELWDTRSYDVVVSYGVFVDADDALSWFGADWSVPALRRRELEEHNTQACGSVSISVPFARRIGGWDPAVPRQGDWDLWKRALTGGARPAASHEPTHVHLRATGRTQGWEERVRQNTAWSERLADPAAVLELRTALWRMRHEQEARDRAWSVEVDAANEWHKADLARWKARAQAAEAELAALRDASGGTAAAG